jgi:alpha-1,2-mannosyltransferase
VALALAVVRIRMAVGDSQPDYGAFFLPAALAVARGESPFPLLPYPPLVPILLAPVSQTDWALEYWTVLRVAAALAACVLGALAVTARGDWLRAGILFGVAATTALWSWPATFDLWLGQVEFLILLCLCAAAWAESRGRRVWAGVFLGIGAAVKTWPVLFLIWSLRRGAEDRLRVWAGAAAAGLAVVASILLVGGPGGILQFVQYGTGPTSQPHLAAASVWGVPRVLFSQSAVGEPLVVSDGALLASTIVGCVIVIGLAALSLIRPGPSVIALFNLAFLVVLALPVSHYTYVLCALPALWWWVGHILRDPRSRVGWVVLAVMSAWWLIVFRVPPEGDGFGDTTWPSLLRIFLASLAAAAVSIFGASRLRVSSTSRAANRAGASRAKAADPA